MKTNLSPPRCDAPVAAPPTWSGEKSATLSALQAWLEAAAHPATLRRALITACIVGFTLIAINHGAAILSGTVTRGRVLQMCLTVVVPYLVSTSASVSTRREMEARRRD